MFFFVLHFSGLDARFDFTSVRTCADAKKRGGLVKQRACVWLCGYN